MTSAQIHSRNMKRLKDKKEGFTVTHFATKTTKRAYHKHFKVSKTIKAIPYIFLASVIGFGVVAKVYYDIGANMTAYAINGPISPVPKPTVSPEIEYSTIQAEDTDTWVGEYVDKYFTSNGQRSEMRMIMHCLLNRESVHGENKGYGDAGKAGGPLQYWADTWTAYRNLMINDKLITEVGSRENMKQAIETTVWAIKTGRANAWGPIYRESNNNHRASCPVPTWY